MLTFHIPLYWSHSLDVRHQSIWFSLLFLLKAWLKTANLHILWKWVSHARPQGSSDSSHRRSRTLGTHGRVAWKLLNAFLSFLRQRAWTGDAGGGGVNSHSTLCCLSCTVMNGAVMVSGLESYPGLLIGQLLELSVSPSQLLSLK